MTAASELHEEAIVIDATCPLLLERAHLGLYQHGGFTAVAPTVNGWSGAREAFGDIGRWHNAVRERDDAVLVRHARDIRNAKAAGKIGIILHFQGSEPIENDLDLVDAYKAAGVGVIQLTYNSRTRFGDGCEEPNDAGLSRLGRRLLARMNEAGVIVDCAHGGYRTSLDALAATTAPAIFSHANAFALHASARNIRDDQIKAIAAARGVIGIVGFPAFVSSDTRPSLDQFIDHAAYIADLVGIDHVGLGLDYFLGQHGVASDGQAQAIYTASVNDGSWDQSYPPPPYHYPAGIETPATFEKLTERLLQREFDKSAILKLLGQNWMRVYGAVWG